MNIKQLKGLLFLINGLYRNDWKIVMKIVETIAEDKAEIISCCWFDSFKIKYPEMYPLKLNELSTWSSYDKSRYLEFTIQDNRLHCHANIFNGDMIYGNPTTKKFSAELYLPDEFIFNLIDEIEYKFNRYTSDKYDEYLENKKRVWVDKEKKKILKYYDQQN